MQLQRPHHQSSIIRHGSQQGISQNDYIQLLRANNDHDDTTASISITAATASNAADNHTLEGKVTATSDGKLSSTVRSEPSGMDAKGNSQITRSFLKSGAAENRLVSRISSSSLEKSPLEPSDMEAKTGVDAEVHGRSVKLLPAGETRKRELKCIGWRQTGNKSPNGPREPHKDLECTDFVPKNASGYCEVEDTKSGERFRVMRRSSNILRNRVPFRCINAPAFAHFHVQAHAAMTKSSDPNYTLPKVSPAVLPPRDGIVMVVYPKLVPSAYATIRTLRDILGSSLPIELWYRPDEMEHTPKALDPLRHLAKNSSGGQISFHQIVDPVATRFVAKVYAIYHSFFDRVLFLDADNVPVRDPSFLFSSLEFLQTGAIFWPDFWHPGSTMFGIHSRSLLWELLDMPFVDMFEQESGQLVVDRQRHAMPLELVLFYATHEPNFFVHYKLAWGDKDLFRLAWLNLNASFHMIKTPPAMAGMVTNMSAFCGMTMVQHDPEGEILFLHRNKHKLTGLESGNTNSNSSESAGLDEHSLNNLSVEDYPDPVIWTHLLSFDGNWGREHYVVQAFTTSLDFSSKQKCFGRRSLSQSPQFHVQPIADQTFAGLETDLRGFAKQATQT
ncbi:hypothetical protein F443_02034 [Phytophthora nicotianae P1569]|uniref:Uncharacterized protein n=1 Tax=Phytophthora nicotianae P1569 TaxID=1317065 RepID=V9FWY8_PHYNI|nr:hypothetical protein F443_02034 [Phytophthora nicotianae P1569]